LPLVQGMRPPSMRCYAGVIASGVEERTPGVARVIDEMRDGSAGHWMRVLPLPPYLPFLPFFPFLFFLAFLA